jgi:Tol biopolymer transport system component
MECSISRPGVSLVFNAHGMGERDIYYADLVSHTVRRIAATPEYETAPSLSPDGKWIAYAAGKPGEREDQLYLRSVDGTVVRQLTSGSANICSPQFFPTGDRIMFTRDTDYHLGGLSANWNGGGSLWSMRTDGSDLRQVLPELGYVFDPRLSPDGKWIVYMGGGLSIYVTRTDGTGSPKKIAGGDARYPEFSPDNKQVVYVDGQYSTTTDMYNISIAGGKPVKILGAPQGCLYPHFTPNGSQIIFQVEDWPNGGSGGPQFSLWRVGLKGAPAVQIAGPVLFADPERAHP